MMNVHVKLLFMFASVRLMGEARGSVSTPRCIVTRTTVSPRARCVTGHTTARTTTTKCPGNALISKVFFFQRILQNNDLFD